MTCEQDSECQTGYCCQKNNSDETSTCIACETNNTSNLAKIGEPC